MFWPVHVALNVICFDIAEVEKALEKSNSIPKKGKKSKKLKAKENGNNGTLTHQKAEAQKTKKEPKEGKNKGTMGRKNTPDGLGPPPEPPARPASTKDGENSEKKMVRPPEGQLPMSSVIKELGTMSLTRTPKKDKEETRTPKKEKEALRPPQVPLPTTTSNPQQRPQMPLPSSTPSHSVAKPPNIPLPPTPDKKPSLNEPAEQKPAVKAPKLSSIPNKPALKPPLKEMKSLDVKPSKVAPPKPSRSKSTDDLGKNTSPVPRPRNKPPPPPGGSSLPQYIDEDSTTITDKRGLSHTWSGKPKPLPRVRPKRPDAMSDDDRQSSQDSLDDSLPESAFRVNLKSPSEPRRGSFPASHRPTTPLKQTSPSKPKPPSKPSLPKKPNVGTLDKKLSPQAQKILKLTIEGQSKAQEIINLTGAREGDNLSDLVDDFLQLSLRVKESLSSMTDSLSPQARFKFRRTVSEFESKYHDLDSVLQTVARNFTAIDMERINKVVCGVHEALDEVCTTLKAMGT